MMNWREKIVADPQICHGQVCFQGTRVLVSSILDNLAVGVLPEEILISYPSISKEDIQAAIAFAADVSRERVVSFSVPA